MSEFTFHVSRITYHVSPLIVAHCYLYQCSSKAMVVCRSLTRSQFALTRHSAAPTSNTQQRGRARVAPSPPPLPADPAAAQSPPPIQPHHLHERASPPDRRV